MRPQDGVCYCPASLVCTCDRCEDCHAVLLWIERERGMTFCIDCASEGFAALLSLTGAA